MAKKPPQPTKTFGEHITELREEAELDVATVAAQVGMSPSDWSAMEADEAMPRLRMIRPMAAALGVKPHEVF